MGRGGWEIWIGVVAGMGERKTLAGIVYIKRQLARTVVPSPALLCDMTRYVTQTFCCILFVRGSGVSG